MGPTCSAAQRSAAAYFILFEYLSGPIEAHRARRSGTDACSCVCVQAETKDVGKNYHPFEGAYLSQVNSIQRHVARDLGIPLVDYETILQQVCGAPNASLSQTRWIPGRRPSLCIAR